MGLFNLDSFKAFSRDYGHQVGNSALRDVARQLRRDALDGEWLYRRSLDEFVCLFSEKSIQDATAAAKRMRHEVEGLGITDANNPRGVLTLSVGVICIDVDHPTNRGIFLEQAAEELSRTRELERDQNLVAVEVTGT
jgi:diguanylate cyclase (GGDEF)-like protein